MKNTSKRGFTLIEMLITILIVVLLAVGIGTGIRAAMRAYNQSIFDSNCGTLSGILNTTIGDALRYSENITLDEENNSFTFTSYDYNVKNGHFILTPAEGNQDAGYVVLSFLADDGTTTIVPLVNDGAYAGDLAVTNLSITARTVDDSGNYYFDISYSIISLSNPDMRRDYTITTRQANADVEVKFTPDAIVDDKKPPETLDEDEIYIVYDSNVPEGSHAVLLDSFSTLYSSLSQTVIPRESVVFHTFGPGDAACKWYTLDGWMLSSSGDTIDFACDTDVYLTQAMIDQIKAQSGNQLTLYAHWTETVFTLIYDANGGTGSYTQTFKRSDGKVSLFSNSDNTISMPKGYTVTFKGNSGKVTADLKDSYSVTVSKQFTGWTDEANTQAYTPGQQFTIEENFISGFDPAVNTVTLKAAWTTAAVTAPTAAKSGWTFVGWSTEKAAKSGIAAGTSVEVSDNCEYYAQWSVQIKFDPNNGTPEPESQLHYYGYDDIKMPSSPTRKGYTFKAWYTAKSGGTKISKASAFASQADGANAVIVFYARWTANTYTVTYLGNGSTSGTMADQTMTYNKYADLTSNAFVRKYTIKFDSNDGSSVGNAVEEWTFANWLCSNKKPYTDGQNVRNLTSTANGKVNMTAQWTAGTVTMPVVTKNNWGFDGWKTGTESYNSGDSHSFGKDTTLTAQWKCEVTYDLNGGTVTSSIPNGSYVYNSNSFNLTSVKPTRTGYNFLGWTTAKDTGDILDNSSAAKYLNTHGNTTLYAKWGGHTYTIKYNANAAGYTGTTADTACVYGEDVTLSSNGFTPNPFGLTFYSTGRSNGSTTQAEIKTIVLTPTFRGWNNPAIKIDAATTPQYVGNNGRVTLKKPDFVSEEGGTYTLYATWNRPKVELSEHKYNPAGWHFEGWSQSKSSTTPSKSADDNILLTQSTALYAVCSRTVIYYEDGVEKESIKYYSNQDAKPLREISARTGYKTPDGWYTSGGIKVTDLANAPYSSDGELKLYATWNTQYKYSITFAPGDGGDTVHSASVPKKIDTDWLSNSTYTGTFTATRTGYTHTGWTASVSGVTTNGTSVSIPGSGAGTVSVTLTATWRADEYTITYNGNSPSTGNNPQTEKYTYAKTGNLPTNLFTKRYTITLNANSGKVNNASTATVYAPCTFNGWKNGSTAYSTYASLSQANKGNVELTAQWSSGQLTANLPTPTRDKWTFDCWKSGNDTYNTSTRYTFTADKALTAQWKCSVSYALDGGSFNQTVNNHTNIIDGNSITISSVKPTKTGHDFLGWSDGSNLYQPGSTYKPSGNTTLTAQWKLHTYTIKYSVTSSDYRLGNGTVISKPTDALPAEAHQDYGTTYTVAGAYSPHTVKDSSNREIGTWSFSGWNKTGSFTVNSDVTITGSWTFTPKTYTVSFNANGHGTAPGSQHIAYGSKASDPGSLTETGWRFDGWLNGNTAYNFDSYVYGNVSLTAKWTVLYQYSISFVSNVPDSSDATGMPSNNSTGFITDSTHTFSWSSNPTHAGFEFLGWATSANGNVLSTSTSYALTGQAASAKSVTLYAKWQPKLFSLNITFTVGKSNPTVYLTFEFPYGNPKGISTSTYREINSKNTPWNIPNLPYGTYVKYKDSENIDSAIFDGSSWKSGDGGVKQILKNTSATFKSKCIVKGTLITLADGTQVPVEKLTGNEQLLVWNLETGKYDSAPIVFIDSDEESEYEVIRVYFSDGTNVGIVSEHGFFDVDLGKYVYLDSNAEQYIGHSFVKQGTGNKWSTVKLTKVEIKEEKTTTYSPVTAQHLCYYVNGMLSMPGGIDGLFNIYDVDIKTMKYDAKAKSADIAKYGLFTYEDFADVIPEDMFFVFNGADLKVAMGKGLLTWEDIAYLAERYTPITEEANQAKSK